MLLLQAGVSVKQIGQIVMYTPLLECLLEGINTESLLYVVLGQAPKAAAQYIDAIGLAHGDQDLDIARKWDSVTNKHLKVRRQYHSTTLSLFAIFFSCRPTQRPHGTSPIMIFLHCWGRS